ncbi:phage adaptor protein [Bartonella sp. B12(2025)]
MTVFPTDNDDLNIPQLDHSKTFSYMVALIQDEIDDTTAEYSVQIQDSILTALRLCEREPFFFNEKREVTFKTQSGKTWYGQEEGIFIESEKALESVLLGAHAATQKQLFFKSVEVLQQEYGLQPSQGTPLFYTYLDHKIGLFPTPQQVETVRFSYVPVRFRDGKMMEEDDPWLIHAFDLIKARAKYELYKNILKDPEYAAVSFRDFQEQLQALRFETSRRKGSSNILPMRF